MTWGLARKQPGCLVVAVVQVGVGVSKNHYARCRDFLDTIQAEPDCNRQNAQMRLASKRMTKSLLTYRLNSVCLALNDV